MIAYSKEGFKSTSNPYSANTLVEIRYWFGIKFSAKYQGSSSNLSILEACKHLNTALKLRVRILLHNISHVTTKTET